MAYPGILRRVFEHIADFAVHGAVSAASANRIALRDAAGRMQAADPSADLDVVNKRTFATRRINTTAPLTGGKDLLADLTLSVSDATVSTVGVVQLATADEAVTGTNLSKAVTPAALKSALSVAGGGTTPQTAEGVGQWTVVYSAELPALANPKNMYLPAGGTWAYIVLEAASYGTNYGVSVKAGGSAIGMVDRYNAFRAACWRIG